METLNSCCCCLLRPADKDLNTPYIFLGATETFSDMLEECFQINFAMGLNEYGICEVCVGRLRDASDFKQQVQRTRAELWERLERDLRVKEEVADEDKVKTSPDDDTDLVEENAISGAEHTSTSTVKLEAPDDELSEKSYISCAVEAWAPSDLGCVKIERLQADKDQSNHTITSASEEYAPKTDITMKNNDDTELCYKQIREKHGFVNNERFHMNDKLKKLDKIQCKPIHNGTTFVCDICNRKFKKKFNLIQHISIHTGIKSYSCEVCNKKFTHSSSLKRHKLTHTGQKLYTCNECNQQFTLKDVLTRHRRIHTGDKPYSCEVCSKNFTQSASFKRHILIHTGQKPYTCDICNKQFTRKAHLTVHSRVHTGEQPYSCEVCSKRFYDLSTLRRHKFTHIQVEKLYKCETCNKRFASKSDLNRHIKTHTRNKP